MNSRILCALLVTALAVQSSWALVCYKCESSETGECTDTADCPADPENICFTKWDSNKITRGCMAKSDTTCSGDTCKTCDKDKCNNQPICKVCEQDDANCAQASLDDNKYNKICDTDNSCVMKVADKKITRSCGASDACGTANTETCNACKSSLCNKGIFPEKRLKCYKCTNDDCNEVKDASNKYCSLYDAADKCYTIGESSTTMQRGCQSDDGAKCTASSTDAKCLACSDASCNNLKYESSSLQCATCSDKGDCMKAQDATKATQCKDIKYTETDACYTQVKDGTVHRGCVSERADELGECSTNTGCETCATKACNVNEKLEGFTCIRCRSDNLADCRDKADAIGGSNCTNPTTGNEKCFEGTWNGVLVRGCLVDADALMQHQCNNKDDNRCTVCDGKNCNTTSKSGTASLQQAVLQLGLGLAVLLVLLRTM